MPVDYGRNGVITNFTITYERSVTADTRLMASDRTDDCDNDVCVISFDNFSTPKALALYEVTIDRLEEYVNYTFTIAAVTAVGVGPRATVSVKTLQAPAATGVRELSISDKTGTELEVSWRPPVISDINGPLKGYIVSIKTDNDDTNFTHRIDSSLSLPDDFQKEAPADVLDGTASSHSFGSLQSYVKYIITSDSFGFFLGYSS